MQFKLSYIFLTLAIFGTLLWCYTRLGRDYVEVNLLDFDVSENSVFVLWRYQEGAADDPDRKSGPFVAAEFDITGRQDMIRDDLKPWTIIRVEYRKTPPWPLTPESPERVILQHLGLDGLPQIPSDLRPLPN